MYIPQGLFSGDFVFMASLPVDKPSRFTLDTSGVIGLLGGDKAVSGMAAVHVYEGRRLLGWYNNPGSFEISQRLSSFAKSVSLRSVFGFGASAAASPSHKPVHTDPATLFGVDGCKGPKFRAAHSGTVIEETGNLAALFVKECTTWDCEGKVVPGRTTQPVGITVVDLGQAPPSEMHPTRGSAATLMFSSLPIAVSVGTCVLSAVVEDWYASSLILVGILASGVFSFVLGSADLVFSHPEPAKGSPAGDGILNSGKDLVERNRRRRELNHPRQVFPPLCERGPCPPRPMVLLPFPHSGHRPAPAHPSSVAVRPDHVPRLFRCLCAVQYPVVLSG